MEPQISYGDTQGQDPYSGQKIYGKGGSGGRKGCFGLVGLLILLVPIILAGYYFVYPMLTPDKIRGDLLDMTIVPQKDGTQKLWILTDGSFNYIQTTSSPGSYSSGRKCFFCKTWTYVYDPISKQVLKKTKTEQKDIITQMDMVYSNRKVWVLTHGYGENAGKIEAYDAESGDLVMDTKQFISKYTQLSAGLADLRYDNENNTVVFKTTDGRDGLIYSFDNDKLYDDNMAMRNEIIKDSTVTSVVVLAEEKSSSQARKKLFKVTGIRGKLIDEKSSLESYANDTSSLRFFVGATDVPLGNRIYLEGIMYYSDADCAIIIHLDQLGKKSNRMMTCVDVNTGKEMWTVQQDDMFSKMKIDENKDAFSSLFFTKDNIKIRRVGNLVVLQFKGEGAMGFDFNTGKKLWALDI